MAPNMETPKSPPERCKTRKNQPSAITNAAGDAEFTQEAPKSEKQRPRTKNRANMAPTCTSFGLDFGGADPPLRKEKQYVNACIKCSRGHTLGAASGAADLEPKTFQNRWRNPKKTMLENNSFSASFLEGFGRRSGRVFGRFFGHVFITLCPNKCTLLICS